MPMSVPVIIWPTMIAMIGISRATVVMPMRILAGIPTTKTFICGTARATRAKARSTTSRTARGRKRQPESEQEHRLEQRGSPSGRIRHAG